MSNELKVKRREEYSVRGLLSTGARMYVDEYTEEDAIKDYLALHPEAVEADVRAELELALRRIDGRK